MDQIFLNEISVSYKRIESKMSTSKLLSSSSLSRSTNQKCAVLSYHTWKMGTVVDRGSISSCLTLLKLLFTSSIDKWHILNVYLRRAILQSCTSKAFTCVFVVFLPILNPSVTKLNLMYYFNASALLSKKRHITSLVICLPLHTNARVLV